VVAPNGYVGKTTTYEIGRIIQAQRPLYFSESPDDLPIKIPTKHICSASHLATLLADKLFIPEPLYSEDGLERDLTKGRYRSDDEF